jgi:site-specific DNA-methyltransferase (adenine-specific)
MSMAELAYLSEGLSTVSKIFEYAPQGKPDDPRIHPTQKPVQLYKWLLKNYAKDGDTILDTHFGSLSIGIACHDMKFDLTAIELDKDYYEQAKQRLINHQRQLTLF